jgi:zinc protease
MLTKGVRGKTAQELAEELETHAIELSASAGMDSAGVTGSAVSGELGRLARLMAEVVKFPTFDEKEFEKLKRQALTGLSIAEKQPASIAEREFRKGLYGEHWYARDPGGSSKEVKALTAADCAEWWRRSARPDQAVLYFAGDVAADLAFELAEGFFEDWPAQGEAPRAGLAELPAKQPTRIVLVDVPGAIQSQIRVGQLGFTRHDPRYFAGRILSQVFGGSFNSRLNKTIRVEKGLTYGARGGFSSERFGGRFFVSTFSKTASTGEAVEAILEEIQRMRDEPPSAAELRQAQSYTLGSFAGDHETPGSIAAELWSLQVHGLEPGFVGAYLDSVVETTPEDVAGVAQSAIDPEHLLIVVVGNAEEVLEDLQAIAEVTVLDEDGLPKQLEVKQG